MLSVSKLGGGAKRYFTEMASQDYYLETGEPQGHWIGEAARKCSFPELVAPEAFSHVFSGFAPDGKTPWIQNAGDKKHQPGWDLTFSAPKSVSVLFGVGEPDVRQEVVASHDQAIRSVAAYLEKELTLTRRGKGGVVQEQAKPFMAAFQHITNRNQDCQLHTHLLVMNVGLRDDGSTGTILSKPFFEQKMMLGAMYRSELAFQLVKRLGLELEAKQTWFEVKGIPKNLLRDLSSRRQEIEAALEKGGYESARSAEVAALATRTDKAHRPQADLFQAWKEHSESYGFDSHSIQRLRDRVSWTSLDVLPEVARSAESLAVEQAHFSKHELIRRVAEKQQVHAIGTSSLIRSVNKWIIEDGIRLQNGAVTTRKQIAREREIIRIAKQSFEQIHDPRKIKNRERILKQQQHLTAEQLEAVNLLTSSYSRVMGLQGLAGTGKTTVLGNVREIWEAKGYQVKGVCFTGKASAGLTEGAGISSQTLDRLFREIDLHDKGFDRKLAKAQYEAWRKENIRWFRKRPPNWNKHILAKMKEQYQKRFGRHPLQKNMVLVVDEAAMVSTNAFHRLMKEVEKVGCRLILAGDARQLQPIEAGGSFKEVCGVVPTANLSDISRQEEAWAKQTVREFAFGNSKEAMQPFQDRERLHRAESFQAAQVSLLEKWSAHGGISKPQEHLMLTARRSDANELNLLAQRERRRVGELGSDFVSEAGWNFYNGDRILFTKNHNQLGVMNGEMGTVKSTSPARRELEVEMDGSSSVTISLDRYSNIQLGYAVTTHKAQGMSVQNAYVLLGSKMQDRELTYVQASRARESTHFFSNAYSDEEWEQMLRRMEQSGKKTFATQHLEPERQYGGY